MPRHGHLHRQPPEVVPDDHVAADQPGPGDPPSSAWCLVWATGPDAGASVVLPPGRHVVGRSPLAAVRCDDPGLEPFHLELDLPRADDVAGSPTSPAWCQLAGRRPVVEVDSGLAIGSSVLRFERTAITDPTAGGGEPHRSQGGPLVRRPRRVAPVRPARVASASARWRVACSFRVAFTLSM